MPQADGGYVALVDGVGHDGGHDGVKVSPRQEREARMRPIIIAGFCDNPKCI